jgi:hypothetical protein
MKLAIATLFTLTAVAACQEATDDNCFDGKCDQPGGSVEQQCKNSRVNAMDERRPHFTQAGVRWSCKDVNGVTADSNTKDDRGQEYCEYFSLVYTKGIPSVVMDANNQPKFCDEATAATACGTGATCDTRIFSCVTGTTADTSGKASILGKNLKADDNVVTGLDPKLTAGQLEWLAQNPDQKVGECVFTSWHQDIDRLPTSSETIGGFALNAKVPNKSQLLFRMAIGFNSNGAAQALVQDCLTAGDQGIKDSYTRACTFCGGANCLPWRKSDPSVCTMAMRVAECGCSLDIADGSGGFKKLDLAKAGDLALAKELFVPTARRGFTLGTWDGIGQLPTGCRYVKTGDSSTVKVGGASFEDPNADQTLVACDLSGAHITAATSKDPKEACRQTYGDEVVVHVRAPVAEMAKLTCDMTKPQCQGIPWDFSNL